MKIKTKQLEGAALDWAVAKSQAVEVEFYGGRLTKVRDNGGIRLIPCIRSTWSPSTDWSQGGPLIDKYQIRFYGVQYLKGRGRGDYIGATIGFAQTVSGENAQEWADVGIGTAHLVAACRAIVAAKLGDEVEVPEELS